MTAAPSAELPSYAAAKASFHVLYATWGATDALTKKDHAVDVTELATDLLLHQGWIDVSATGLRSDPWPGQSKFLYIRYEVLGKQTKLAVSARRVLTLDRLFKHARVFPANPDEGSGEGT